MIYLTGDTHGDFERIAKFCVRHNTSKKDVLVILGDAGFNYHGGLTDHKKKMYVSLLPITLLCIHGNHEQRPSNIPSYFEHEWRGGIVYREEMYPDILFAKDGEIYDLDGTKTIVIGGAYSVDKWYRLANRDKWWYDEQPTPAIREYVEEQLEKVAWKIDAVLSHTCPVTHEPIEVFLPGLDPRTVDKSTEIWLNEIEERLDYKKWFCGHFHTDKQDGKLTFLFESYTTLQEPYLQE